MPKTIPPMDWQPIETAPKNNTALFYLARFDKDGTLVELDYDASWEYWQESWELAHINGYDWRSANGIDEPTHWAYQEVPEEQPADADWWIAELRALWGNPDHKVTLDTRRAAYVAITLGPLAVGDAGPEGD